MSWLTLGLLWTDSWSSVDEVLSNMLIECQCNVNWVLIKMLIRVINWHLAADAFSVYITYRDIYRNLDLNWLITLCGQAGSKKRRESQVLQLHQSTIDQKPADAGRFLLIASLCTLVNICTFFCLLITMPIFFINRTVISESKTKESIFEDTGTNQEQVWTSGVSVESYG